MFRKTLFLVIAIAVACSGIAFAHCQIPCGIYDDQMRVDMIAEDIATIEKSIKSIIQLSQEKTPDYNQLVRWVNNKEHHADHIKEVVTEYFMCQRVAPVAPDNAAYATYVLQVTLLHQLNVYAMKAKQGTDAAVVEKLRALLDQFSKSYFKIEK